MDWLEQAAQFTVIVVALGGMFNYAVVSPLQKSIDALKDEIAELRKDRERIHLLEIGLAELKQATGAAHHRIDELLEVKHEKLGH